jgi:polyisoprenoid-binding protein YceI
MKTITRLSAALVLAASTLAPAFAAPATFASDPNHTFARFSYNHLGFSEQSSRFDTVGGTVVLDPQAKTGSVDIKIDTKSVSTGSALFNQHIQGADYLDTAQFSSATFKSTKVNFDGDKPATIEGNLTLKGVTKPVLLTVTHYKLAPHPMLKKDTVGATATTTVKRSDFNMGKNAPYVGDDVKIDVSIEAIKQ